MVRSFAPALLLLRASFAIAQTGVQTLEFEAASIKPSPAGTPYGGMHGGPGTSSPGQIHYEATTLRAVVARAYGVQRFQILGPPWFDDERFEIVAKIPPGTTLAQFQLMLQKLLADRFHLDLHKENRISSTYEMTVAKSGMKMKAVPTPATPGVPPAEASPAPSPVLQSRVAGGKEVLWGSHITMRQFLVWLSEETHREIVDHTGLTEAYDFELPWQPDILLWDPADPSNADILDKDIEKYLGLKVAERKIPVEMLIIDRLDRTPVQN